MKKITMSLILVFALLFPTATSMVFALENPKDVVEVRGRIIKINGQILNLEVDPVVENGTTLVQLRPIFSALNMKLDWDGLTQKITGSKDNFSVELRINEKNASVNGKLYTLEVPARIINGSTVVPLRFLSESLGAKVEYTYYPVENRFDIDETEKNLRKAYNDALYLYTASVDNYHEDLKLVEKAQSKDLYTIGGEITSLEPFVVWGKTSPENREDFTSGAYLTTNSNIIILNPDEKNILFGKTYFGKHYYMGTRTGKGVLGQSVLVFVFGGSPSSEVQQQVATAKQKLQDSEQSVYSTEDVLKTTKQKLLDYINSLYEGKISNEFDNGAYHYQYAIHLLDVSKYLKDSEVENKAKEELEVAKNINGNYEAYYKLYLSQSMGEEERVKEILSVAKTDMYLLLNYAKTPEQQYMVANALYKEFPDTARSLLQLSSLKADSQLSESIKKLLKEMDKEKAIQRVKEENEKKKQEENQKLQKLREEEQKVVDQFKEEVFSYLRMYENEFYSQLKTMPFKDRVKLFDSTLNAKYRDRADELSRKSIEVAKKLHYVEIPEVQYIFSQVKSSVIHLSNYYDTDVSESELKLAISLAEQFGFKNK